MTMKRQTMMMLLAVAVLVAPVPAALAQDTTPATQSVSNRIENFEVAEQGGVLFIRLTMQEPLANPPASFSVANPARIAFDFPGTANALGRTQQNINQGDLRSANIVQAGDRTRLVLNLIRVTPYETRVDGRDLIITLSPTAGQTASATQVTQALANFAAPRSATAGTKSVQDIQFRRGTDGEGRVVVQLGSPDMGIDIRQQGANLIVEFLNASLPDHLHRRSDVTDFGTPITMMTAQPQGNNVRLVVTPSGLWEHNAYQSDTQFVLEVRRVVEDPTRLVHGAARGEYAGEKLSLNFQNIDVRSVLQVIADFTNFNIVTSDSVSGNLTLRLKDVPWDQALDIILQAKGLDMRKTGNVIWIAPGEELAAREKMQLEALAQIGDLEPLQTESFQVNYHQAKDIFNFLKSRDQTVLSQRGSVVFDDRSNKLFVTDVGSRLDDIRRLVQEIDIAPRQVLIEARIVEANKDFARDLGVRLTLGGGRGPSLGGNTRIGLGQFSGGALTGNGFTSGGAAPVATFSTLNLSLFNSASTRFLNLELSALETDGRGRVVSSPRVLTANQVEASIEQGTEIPYRKETSSGATSVEFKKAVLSLRVRPQITPDGRVQLRVQVNKDRPQFLPGFSEPAIDTKNVETEVLVENGGTVVIGGIYEEEETDATAKVPVLGDVPVLGALFRNNRVLSNRKELLVFITPRIVTESLTLR
jgi:type IV pilus assembly protein PilQ